MATRCQEHWPAAWPGGRAVGEGQFFRWHRLRPSQTFVSVSESLFSFALRPENPSFLCPARNKSPYLSKLHLKATLSEDLSTEEDFTCSHGTGFRLTWLWLGWVAWERGQQCVSLQQKGCAWTEPSCSRVGRHLTVSVTRHPCVSVMSCPG